MEQEKDKEGTGQLWRVLHYLMAWLLVRFFCELCFLREKCSYKILRLQEIH